MTKKMKTALIFAAIEIAAIVFAAANFAIGCAGMNYIKQDIENNKIIFLGVEYGAGLGSLSFCARANAAGVAGVMAAVIAGLTFPVWLKAAEQEEGD